MANIRAALLFGTGLALAVGTLAVAGDVRIVDATAPVRNRLRPPTAGHFGSVGYELPVRITVERDNTAAGNNGDWDVDFAITNVGKTAIQLPISIHPRDLEPSDPNMSYAVTVLRIYLTQPNGRESLLRSGVDLYGSPKFPETMKVLSPGDSIQVIARMLRVATGLALNETLRCHVVLEEQKVSMKNGQVFGDTNELGSAQSDEFRLDSLGVRPK